MPVVLRAGAVREWVREVLTREGVAGDDAGVVADVLVDADLRGVASHGVSRLPDYVARIRRGTWRRNAELRVLAGGPSLVLADAGDGIGPVMALRAMSLAVARARETGAGVVVLRRAGHFGRAAYFAAQAAEQGMIGAVLTNASASMAPWGGKRRVLGNNPFAVAVPRRAAPPIVLDLALSAVAQGKIRFARDRGETIPEGWGLDPEGRPTRDPGAALKGTLLPIGGYKGYGLALVIDLLTGVLAGSGFGTAVASPREHDRPQNVGQLFAALDAGRIRAPEAFLEDVERLVSMVKSDAPAVPGGEVLLPGEPEERARARHGDSLVLPDDVHAAVTKLAAEIGVPSGPPIQKDDAR